MGFLKEIQLFIMCIRGLVSELSKALGLGILKKVQDWGGHCHKTVIIHMKFSCSLPNNNVNIFNLFAGNLIALPGGCETCACVSSILLYIRII